MSSERFTARDGRERVVSFAPATKGQPGLYWDISLPSRPETTGFAFYGPLGVRALFDAPHHKKDPLDTYGGNFEKVLAKHLTAFLGPVAKAPARAPTPASGPRPQSELGSRAMTTKVAVGRRNPAEPADAFLRAWTRTG